MKIAVDTMGGDLGSKVIVEAIKNFLKDFSDVEITAVGKKEELQELVGLAEIVDARSVVPMDAGALEVMRMKDSSMYKAVELVRNGGYDAVISAGSTGGFLSVATLCLKNIKGILRAALISPFPTKIKGKQVVMLDIGASNENSPQELLQFGLMGKLYAKHVLGNENPNTYLLSNGSEEGKGSPVGKLAYKLYEESKFEGFKGNIEAREVLSGEADVVVTDGYTGNILLKGIEGVAKMMGGMIKSAFKKNLWTKLGYLHVHKGMKEMSETMDYKTTGGAMLLGVNGVVVKAHGSSDEVAFYHALKVAYKLAKADIINKIKEGI